MQNFSEQNIQVNFFSVQPLLQHKLQLFFSKKNFSADEYIMCIKSFCIPFREQKSNSISAINGTGSWLITIQRHIKTSRNLQIRIFGTM